MSRVKRLAEQLQEQGKLDSTFNWMDKEMGTRYDAWRRDINIENERVELINKS